MSTQRTLSRILRPTAAFSLGALLLLILVAGSFLRLSGSQRPTSAARHVVVHHEPGRFCGWPANNGVWIWGDEILVGFVYGHFEANDESHSIDRNKPQDSVLARSLDGGETWTLEDPTISFSMAESRSPAPEESTTATRTSPCASETTR